jgi:GNAT superfamily N-acetyltransferase
MSEMSLTNVAIDIVDSDELDAEARIGVRRIGYLWCCRDGSGLQIADLQVNEEYRRHGIGTKLLHLVLTTADEAGIEEIWGGITKDDLARWPGLIDWYKRNGFVVSEPDVDIRQPQFERKVVRREGANQQHSE